jgi:hypothetical protein
VFEREIEREREREREREKKRERERFKHEPDARNELRVLSSIFIIQFFFH